ncbi:uncharacterized protein LOC119985979 [Tripterygium wilfordii]|uniref:uncharacterized protein LOC119985979 n=1 Tax=Tripterygium wilfordii TaxID=458696 RepID=UPI0018F7ED5B|nr:uncharacterized protein LOC119985979 [Tripterygium wilfordii]
MMSGHVFLCKSSRSSASFIKALTPYLYNPIKLYSSQASDKQGEKVQEFIEERAPSTAQMFKTVAEEKQRKETAQGHDIETVEEAAGYGDSKAGSGKGRYKKHEEDHSKD